MEEFLSLLVNIKEWDNGRLRVYRSFLFPCRTDCILVNHLTNPKELEIQSLVLRLTEMHFYTGRSGWTDSLIEQHRKLSWRLNILVEEVQGLECVQFHYII